MDLRKRSLRFVFGVALLFTYLFSLTALKIQPWFFVPFLVFVIYQKQLPFALWAAAFTGIFIDLQGEDSWFGATSIAFCLTIIITRKLRGYFFSDKLSTLPIMTCIFSCLATVIRLVGITLLQRKFPSPLTKELVIQDLLFVPALDAAFGFIVYILPFFLIDRRRRASE